MFTLSTLITPPVPTFPVTIVLTGELDAATGPDLVDTARHLFGDVDLWLDGVTFLDTAGIGALVYMDNTRRAAGSRMRVKSFSAAVERTLVLTGLGHLLPSMSAHRHRGLHTVPCNPPAAA